MLLVFKELCLQIPRCQRKFPPKIYSFMSGIWVNFWMDQTMVNIKRKTCALVWRAQKGPTALLWFSGPNCLNSDKSKFKNVLQCSAVFPSVKKSIMKECDTVTEWRKLKRHPHQTQYGISDWILDQEKHTCRNTSEIWGSICKWVNNLESMLIS